MVRRSSDRPGAGDASPEAGPTTTPPETGRQPAVDAVARGDELSATANDHRTAGEDDRAGALYDAAAEAYRAALDSAIESPEIDTDELERKLGAIADDRRDLRRRRLEDRIETLWSGLDRTDTLVANGTWTTAEERLTELTPRIDAGRAVADQFGFADLADELTAVERRRDECRSMLAERRTVRPIPDEVPGAPRLSIEYDALGEEEPIGGGGTADVTKAVISTPDGDVTVAIKRPRIVATLHRDTIDRIFAEAETWSKLDSHDHIVGVIDWGSEPIPWIAMEYMDGGHLGERVGEMDFAQAVWTATAVTEGVRHAHRRGVAHLDLKPENILFRTIEDQWDVPKIGDWGLSKHLLEYSQSIEGLSPRYAAPEQFSDDYGSADDLTDIYQLGAVFYELFTGQPPFEGSAAQILHQVLTEAPMPPSELAAVPAALDDILLTALAKEKAARFEHVVYLRDALEDLADG